MPDQHETPALAEAGPQPLDLAAIRARVDAATPGPWAIVERNGDPIRRKLRGADNRFILGLAALLYPDPADADFLTHAREDVPALLAEVEHLQGLAMGLSIDAERAAAERDELAAQVRQARAEGWDEGAEYSVGYSTAPLYDNPYREGRS